MSLFLASKSFAAVREAISNAYSEKDVPKMRHQMVTKFRWMLLFENVVDIFSICCEAVLQVLTNKQKLKTIRCYCYIDVTKVYTFYCC
jgi:hypothetical protein